MVGGRAWGIQNGRGGVKLYPYKKVLELKMFYSCFKGGNPGHLSFSHTEAGGGEQFSATSKRGRAQNVLPCLVINDRLFVFWDRS